MSPRGHWLLVLIWLVLLAGSLFLNGYTHSEIGETEPVPAAAPAPEEVRKGGPAISVRDGLRTARATKKTLALTFDDGPDPRWTPKILDVLKRHGARATFFVVGARVAENPGLTQRILDEGHEIGVHTYAHADLAQTPPWRSDLELKLTQQAIAGAVGIQTSIMRPPYVSTNEALSGEQWAAVRDASRQGYTVILSDRDTQDWARPGTEKIVSAARKGGVVMMHDSGGNRAQTVEAVDRLLSRTKLRATTVTEAAGLPEAHARADVSWAITGTALVLAQQFALIADEGLGILLIVTGVLTLGRIVFFIGFASVHARRARRRRGRRARGTHKWDRPPAVSVIVPAYNEGKSIAATLRSMRYPGPFEVICVDDGSTDATARIAESVPGVRVIRRPNGGKPAALNTGIRAARADILILVDGDTVFERTTIEQLIAPLADPSIGAVAGNTKVANRKGILGRWQHIEYVIGFNLDRRAFDLLGCMPTVPGAIGAFRRAAIPDGVPGDTLAEDTDLTMALCRTGWRVVYNEHARAWTEAPSSIRQLWRQRYRWCYGTLQAMWKHRRALIERGRFGRRCLGYFTVFQVLLPLIAPAVDVAAIYGLVFGRPLPVIGVWLGFVIAQAFVGWYALRLDRERWTTLWVLPLQQFVYRQLMHLVVIHSVVTALLGVRLRWHAIRREGTFQRGRIPARSR